MIIDVLIQSGQNMDLKKGILDLDARFSSLAYLQGFLFANQLNSKSHKEGFSTITSIFFWFWFWKCLAQSNAESFYEAFKN